MEVEEEGSEIVISDLDSLTDSSQEIQKIKKGKRKTNKQNPPLMMKFYVHKAKKTAAGTKDKIHKTGKRKS